MPLAARIAHFTSLLLKHFSMMLSYIIPTLNEEDHLPQLLDRLIAGKKEEDEIIVVDGGSKDATLAICCKAGVQSITLSRGCRAIQMNKGASLAKGDVLFFIHADTLPPKSHREDIMRTLKAQADAGSFRTQFDSNLFILKLNAFFTRFSPLWCRGGDQGLFVKKAVFQEMQGFCEDHRIMEDYEFLQRLRDNYNFQVVPKDFIVSARKYDSNSYIRVQWANFLVFRAFLKGASQEKLIHTYRKWLILP